jgi:hypothetical protein
MRKEFERISAKDNGKRGHPLSALHSKQKQVAIAMQIAPHPPRRSVRALLTHTAPALDVWRQTSLAEKDEECGDGAASDQISFLTFLY